MFTKNIASVLVGAAAAFAASSAYAAAITPGDLVVYQVGTTGSTTVLGSAATASYLDEYATTGGAQVQQIASPTADAGTTHALTNSGSASSEGSLTTSSNGTYIAFGGYDAAPTTAGVVASSASRVVGILNTTTGLIDTSTALTDAYAANNIRGAYTADGTNIYTSGTSSTTGGVHYTTIGSTTSTILTPSTGTGGANNGNTRTVQVYNGQLYVGAASSTTVYGIGAIGTGTPTTAGQTITSLGVDNNTTSTVNSPYSFAFASLGGSTNPDTVYIADADIGILKYSLVGSTWTATGSVPITGGVTGIDAVSNGSSESLYAVGATALYSLSDVSGYDGTLTGTPTTLETASTNTAFRGLAYVPAVPEPASLSVLALLGLVARRRR